MNDKLEKLLEGTEASWAEIGYGGTVVRLNEPSIHVLMNHSNPAWVKELLGPVNYEFLKRLDEFYYEFHLAKSTIQTMNGSYDMSPITYWITLDFSSLANLGRGETFTKVGFRSSQTERYPEMVEVSFEMSWTSDAESFWMEDVKFTSDHIGLASIDEAIMSYKIAAKFAGWLLPGVQELTQP